MIRIGYKVVNHCLESLLAPGKYTRQYKLGTTVREVKNTIGIMIFGTYSDALTFAHFSILFTRPTVVILKVEYDDGDLKPTPREISGITAADYLDDYYHDVLDTSMRISPPLGTICCSKIKVISKRKEVDWL